MQVDRIFLSSTFLDFAWEREFLNTELVPALNEELRSEGREIDLLDLRWGVSRDAGLDNHAVDICMVRTLCVCPVRFFSHAQNKNWQA